MPCEIRLPALGESMTEATLVAWLKREGDPIEAGEPIAEIESEKSNVDLEAPESGTLHRIVVPAGTEGVQVGEILAVILSPEESVPAGPAAGVAIERARATDAAPSDPAAGLDRSAGVAAPAGPAMVAASGLADEAVDAAPLARRMAALAGLDLTVISGTGPRGRVRKVDVEAALATSPSSPGAEAPRAAARYVEHPLPRVRRITATRMARSKQTVPHFYLRVECVVDALLARRAEINAGRAEPITLNDLVIMATGRALRRVPAANVVWSDQMVRV